jgi:hypothetical protein
MHGYEKQEKTLYILRKTRKAFIIEYICGGFLILLLLVSIIKGSFQNIGYFIGILGLIAIGSAELSRILTRYTIKESKIVITKGLIKQVKKNVYFHPLGFVPDLNIKQSRLQRVMNYGSIYLKEGQNSTFEIKDVNGPQKIMNVIERLIEKNRVVKPED